MESESLTLTFGCKCICVHVCIVQLDFTRFSGYVGCGTSGRELSNYSQVEAY